MSENAKIEWCDHTFNPWEGCQKVGPGCDNCYAESRNARFAGGQAINWGAGAPRRRTSAANWRRPLKWNANACWFVQCNTCGWRGESKGAVCGSCHGCDTSPARQRVFCASLADVFDNAVDPHWRADLFSLIAKTPHLDWLLLTKRIGNVHGMLAELAHGSDPDLSLLDMMPLPNVWIGATITSQAEADRDIPKLLDVPARVRFLSMEPLLGPVDLGFMEPCDHARQSCEDIGCWNSLDWVIVGGESGPGARPMHPDWARSLRDQCQAASVPFLFKQWGEWLPWHHFSDVGIDDGDGAQPTKFETREWCDGCWHEVGRPDYLDSMDGAIDDEQCVGRVGKKAAGRLLDGRIWSEFPSAGDKPPMTMYYGSPDCKAHAFPLSGRTEIEG